MAHRRRAPDSASSMNLTSATMSASATNLSLSALEAEEAEEDENDPLRFDLDRHFNFNDLSRRSGVFRSRLINEFQLIEALKARKSAKVPPSFGSQDVQDAERVLAMLKDNPFQLVKFKTFKRPFKPNKVDRRLTRIKNKDVVPLGAWANWVTEQNPLFSRIVLFVLLGGAILVGVATELQPQASEYYVFFMVMEFLDTSFLIVFYVEIFLKWLDSFGLYWNDPWNIFDFVVTVGTTIPELLKYFDTGSSGSDFGRIVQQLRIVRILRSLKLAVRFGSLKVIVVTIVEVFKTMGFIMFLLFLVIMIFALIANASFEAYSMSEIPDLRYRYAFQDLGMSLRTLFQLLTLDNWVDLTNDIIRAVDPVVALFFIILWVLIGAFIFRNIFVGVMGKRTSSDPAKAITHPACEVNNFSKVSERIQEERREFRRRKRLEKMRKKLRKELQSETHSRAAETLGTTPGGASDGQARTNSSSRDPRSSNLHLRDYLTTSHSSRGWEIIISETIHALSSHQEETMWPRDLLFRYLLMMENLQENMQEYQELSQLANVTLLKIHDT